MTQEETARSWLLDAVHSRPERVDHAVSGRLHTMPTLNLPSDLTRSVLREMIAEGLIETWPVAVDGKVKMSDCFFLTSLGGEAWESLGNPSWNMAWSSWDVSIYSDGPIVAKPLDSPEDFGRPPEFIRVVESGNTDLLEHIIEHTCPRSSVISEVRKQAVASWKPLYWKSLEGGYQAIIFMVGVVDGSDSWVFRDLDELDDWKGRRFE